MPSERDAAEVAAPDLAAGQPAAGRDVRHEVAHVEVRWRR